MIRPAKADKKLLQPIDGICVAKYAKKIFLKIKLATKTCHKLFTHLHKVEILYTEITA